MDSRKQFREIIVVEGLHDKQAIERVVSADIWILGGDRIARSVLAELRRASERRGVIVFTDPDGPGERIRKRVDDAIPGCKHAFLSKRSATSSHGIGVEHAGVDAILEALSHVRRSGNGSSGANEETHEPPGRGEPAGGDVDRTSPRLGERQPEFTMDDLNQTGLANHPKAASRRQQVGEALSIGYGNAKAFLRKLNALEVTRDEWTAALSKLKEAPCE